ncbi:TetR/AcrR family transcriptional regulator [Actinoallomurus iriomotensis]|nr:TetR/AcrR family transcriptional regulator [Actinoallomurus iriomotensis]
MTNSPSPTPRRRAPGMSAEQRRQMIVAAALPLVAEYGAAVTTSQIARAAGIGEATIFRAFADKEEVLGACMAEAMRSDHVVRQIASIPLDQPLPARLIEAVDTLDAYLARMGALAGALYASGRGPRRPGGEPPPANSREESMVAIRAAVAELFEPGEDDLRLDADDAAGIFLGFLFARPRVNGERAVSSERLVDVFLHGALAGGDR